MKMPESDIVEGGVSHMTGRSHFGVVIALLVVLLIAILAGLYYWYSAILSQPMTIEDPAMRPTAEENNEPESTGAEAQADSMNVVSTSDELSAIEADLESTDLNSLDTEMGSIDTEMNAALDAQ